MDRAPVPAPAELRELEALAVELAVAAGRLIVDERPDDLGVADTKSSSTDIVTEMDRRSEQLLRARIAEARPHDAVLGEEAGAGHTPRDWSGLTWVVDPIDGTVNYLYGLPEYAVSVAVVTGDPTVPGAWETVAGAVSRPSVDELFHARAGGGSFLTTMSGSTVSGSTVSGSSNSAVARRLHVTTGVPVERALVGTGFGYRSDVRARQGAVAAQVLPRIRDLRRGGSAAIDLCSVAAGRLDGYYESGLHPWDLAAGLLVVTEAGGVVRGRGTEPPGSALVLAAAPELADGLEAILADVAG
ncbi:MAG TPA: inositol monophosphatase family protein [Segeticoccus sp.]|uniref:inositol monophosphatase family protein n=1 Tax=Segeticoccus sp. TaxID=2706531 RepID=UPI002D8088B6|nr:inositol monophosphatase family protein [Segeticoccus sp.]HET8601437.1 inositol monophosphatase family protein [Segeticoccus sp.]